MMLKVTCFLDVDLADVLKLPDGDVQGAEGPCPPNAGSAAVVLIRRRAWSGHTCVLVIENSPPLNENLPLTSASGKLSNSAEAVFGIHIVHFNPPLETSVGFERKYLKIGQIALLLTH